MAEGEHVQWNEPLRAVMDRYMIRVLEGEERDVQAMPEDFSYQGRSPIVEVRMGDHAAFCRFEGIGGPAYIGKERWLTRYPDWEGYLLAALLGEARSIRWFEKHDGMEGWLYDYGRFGGETENRHEWAYARRAADDLDRLLGEAILNELLQACGQCSWEIDDL